MNLVLNIDLDNGNEAFGHKWEATALILRQLARRLVEPEPTNCPRNLPKHCDQASWPLLDVNGNKVGEWGLDKNPGASLTEFTVLLLLPDYATDNYGETEVVFVDAPTPAAAVPKAQEDYMNFVKTHDVHIEQPDDLRPVAIFAGHHEDLIAYYLVAKENG